MLDLITGEQFVLGCKIVGGIATVCGALYSLYVYVLSPYVIIPIIDKVKFLWATAQDVSSIHAIIKKELTTNGGSSIKDAVKRIEINNIIINAKCTGIDKPTWEADAQGNCIWINTSLMQILGYDINTLKDSGWLSIIDSNDVSRVRDEWRRAVEEERMFHCVYTIVRSDYTRIPIFNHATPIMLNGTLVGYVGSLEKLDGNSLIPEILAKNVSELR